MDQRIVYLVRLGIKVILSSFFESQKLTKNILFYPSFGAMLLDSPVNNIDLINLQIVLGLHSRKQLLPLLE